MMCSSARRGPDLIIEGGVKISFSASLFLLGFRKYIYIPQVVFGWDQVLSVQGSSLVVLIQNLSIFQHNPILQVTNPNLLYRNVQLKIGRTE